MSGIRRFWRHLVTDHGSARRAFPRPVLDRIETAIASGETTHRGQVRVVIEAALPLARVMAGVSPRERALEVFGLTRTWDTEENCGVLLYVLLADRDVEIVADRGIHARVGDTTWEAVCRQVEAAFRERRFAEGAKAGVTEVNALIARHFPRAPGETARRNELPDRPLLI